MTSSSIGNLFFSICFSSAIQCYLSHFCLSSTIWKKLILITRKPANVINVGVSLFPNLVSLIRVRVHLLRLNWTASKKQSVGQTHLISIIKNVRFVRTCACWANLPALSFSIVLRKEHRSLSQSDTRAFGTDSSNSQFSSFLIRFVVLNCRLRIFADFDQRRRLVCQTSANHQPFLFSFLCSTFVFLIRIRYRNATATLSIH